MSDLEDIAYIREQVDKIAGCLYGNGQIGLVTRITLVEAFQHKNSGNWKTLIETLIKDVLLIGIMWVLLR